MVADSSVNRSIFNLKQGEDKVKQLNDKTVLAMSGEQTDRDTYGELVMRNLKLNEFKMGHRLSLEAQA